MWYHLCGITYVVSLMWYHLCGITYVVSLMWYHLCGITYVVSLMWYHLCGITYVVSLMWYHLCGIRYHVTRQIRINNPKKVILGHLNINSLRTKFNRFMDIVATNLDILLVSIIVTIDYSFLVTQFSHEGYCKLYRKDRNTIFLRT